MGPGRRLAAPTIAMVALCALGPASARAQGTPTDRRIDGDQRLLKRHPCDARGYYRLGDAYVQKARETGDVSYFTLAENALRESLAIAPGTRKLNVTACAARRRAGSAIHSLFRNETTAHHRPSRVKLTDDRLP